MDSGDGAANPISRWAYLLVPIALLIAITTMGLGTRPFWYDELVTANAVENGLSGLFAHTWEFPLIPYYALMYVWTLGGNLNADWWMRALSILFAVGAVLFTGLTGRLLNGKRVGFAAAFVVAISPWMGYYSQNARSYTLGALLVASSTYFMIRGSGDSGRRIWLPYSAVLALAAVFIQTALIVLVVHPVVLALRSSSRAWVKPWLRSALLVTPLLVIALVMYTSKGPSMHGWLAAPAVGDLWKGLPQVTRWEPLALILTTSAVLTRQGFAWLAGVVVGVLGIWAVSHVGVSFWLDGVLGMLVSVFALAAASTMALVSWRHAVMWCLFIAVIAAGHLIQVQTRVDETRYAATLAATIAAKGNDAVIASDPNKVARMALRHYSPDVRVRLADMPNPSGPRWYLGAPNNCLGAESIPLQEGLTLTYCPT